jgi:hypothetical protein
MEMPTITGVSYGSNTEAVSAASMKFMPTSSSALGKSTYDLGNEDWMKELGIGAIQVHPTGQRGNDMVDAAAARALIRKMSVGAHVNTESQQATEAKIEENQPVPRRLVRVLIVDPNDQVPVAQAMIYDSKEIWTELDNQELFFEADIASKLKDYNEKVRTKIIDKKAKTEAGGALPTLPAARIRELQMRVVEIASF